MEWLLGEEAEAPGRFDDFQRLRLEEEELDEEPAADLLRRCCGAGVPVLLPSAGRGGVEDVEVEEEDLAKLGTGSESTMVADGGEVSVSATWSSGGGNDFGLGCLKNAERIARWLHKADNGVACEARLASLGGFVFSIFYLYLAFGIWHLTFTFCTT